LHSPGCHLRKHNFVTVGDDEIRDRGGYTAHFCIFIFLNTFKFLF
jgi:hypothetical protein